jgi:hypothetical protein
VRGLPIWSGLVGLVYKAASFSGLFSFLVFFFLTFDGRAYQMLKIPKYPLLVSATHFYSKSQILTATGGGGDEMGGSRSAASKISTLACTHTRRCATSSTFASTTRSENPSLLGLGFKSENPQSRRHVRELLAEKHFPYFWF